MRLVKVERHARGPRLHVFGGRVHECYAGLAVAAIATLALVAHGAEVLAAGLAMLAAWLIVKDWRDFHPATRDTAAWSLGVHRRPDGPPAPPLRDRVPALAAAATAAVGAINVGAALAAELPARARAVLAFAPAGEVRLAHALALPVGLALLAVAWPLARRRRHALHLAVFLLAAVGVVDVVRSLHLGIAGLSWGVAVLLWRSRAAFWVLHRRPRGGGDALDRRRAAVVVRRHGSDTLSAFKLRRDVRRLFGAGGHGMVGYRVEAGALLVAGDPVAPVDAFPELLDEAIEYARSHGLAVGAVGASEAFADVARRAGLSRLYLGDEALLPAGPMDLSGGARKSLRKAVNRIERNGFSAEVCTVGELTPAAVDELEQLSARWRDGAPERGFSMAHDALVDDLLDDASVVLARDAAGRIRGFLHFVPVFGRPAVSLAFMRRDRDTPNGLTDFLVVEAARLLGERGVEELSLNFAAFGRWLRAPANAFERLAARVLHVGDRWFQIERLLRFNAKFDPRWQPRYLLYAGGLQLPRVALAALWAEGQMPRPPRLRRRARAAREVAPARA